MKIKSDFMKSVPLEKREVVQKKLSEFAKLIPSKRSLADIPKGFWIRKVAGTDIFKFRVNSGDRILFQYDTQGEIIFLSFQSHDNQIRIAKGNSQYNNLIDFKINQDAYEQENIDDIIDSYIQQELYENIQKIEKFEVVDDEYIDFIVKDKSDEFIFTLEQFECIKEMNNPIVIWGCAGSGKTSIALRKAILNAVLNVDTLYITKSSGLIENIKALNLTLNDQKIIFMSLQTLLTEEICFKGKVVHYNDFYEWLIQSGTLDELKGFSERELWIEINAIIKGYLVTDRMMGLTDYLNYDASNFNEKTKRHIYLLASKYQFWLQKNNLYDFNDLAYFVLQQENVKTYSFVICDEVQEFTKKQIAVLMRFVKKVNKFALLGDTAQCTDNYLFDLNNLKQKVFSAGFELKQFYINKNYRSPNLIVNILNRLEEIKGSYFTTVKREQDIPIRSGGQPTLMRFEKEHFKLLKDIQNDSQAVIVVTDVYTKSLLNEQGISRIFLIEEMRGLEYESVYLFNVLTNLKAVWKIIFERQLGIRLYETYLNLLYLAITRSKETIIIMEEEETILEKMLSEAVQFNDIFEYSLNESDKQQWLLEAEQLFKLQNYEQAAYAYEQAGNTDKMQLARKLQNHIQFNEYEEKYEAYIILKSDKFTKYHLQQFLKTLEHIKGYQIKGRVRIEVGFNKGFKGKKRIELFIPFDIDQAEIAKLIYEELSESILNKSTLLFEVTLFIDGQPIQLNDRGIYIEIAGINIRARWFDVSEISESFEIQDEISRQFNKRNEVVKGNYGYIFQEVEKSRIQKLTGKEILNHIFKGNE